MEPMVPMDANEPLNLFLSDEAAKELKRVADGELRTSSAQATVFVLEALGLMKKNGAALAPTPTLKRVR